MQLSYTLLLVATSHIVNGQGVFGQFGGTPPMKFGHAHGVSPRILLILHAAKSLQTCGTKSVGQKCRFHVPKAIRKHTDSETGSAACANGHEVR